MSTNLLVDIGTAVGAIALLFCNAVFVGCQFALVRLRFSLFKDEVESQVSSKSVKYVLGRADYFAQFLQLGIVVCSLGYGLVFFLWLQCWLTESILNGVMAGAGAFLVTASLHYLFGELMPRALGIQAPVRILEIFSWPLAILGWLAKPVVRVHAAIVRLLLKGVRVSVAPGMGHLEIESQVRESDTSDTAVTRTIMRNAFDLRELTVRYILLPRNQVQVFDLNESIATNLEGAKKTGHTRFPLCEGDFDRCIGLIHIKDVFRAPGPIDRIDLRQIRRDILRVNPNDSLEDTLTRLLKAKAHMALVIDEFGGSMGLVTLEQILEELVGDIQDEFDAEEALVKPVADGVYLVSGLTPIHDLEEMLELEIDCENVATFGGLISAELGRIPDQEDELTFERLHIVVTEVDDRRVIAARVRVLPPEEEESGD